jgi:signal transduction histidine kinase
LGWVTPESLDRRRTTSANRELKTILDTNAFGLVIAVPNGSSQPSLIVATGKRQDERPFTFPEIERIQNLVCLIESIMARSRLVDQTTQKTTADFVAAMSCGLAHDLKNLITPISTFFSHIEHAFQKQLTEVQVYASAKRAVRKMSDYVWNALSLPDRTGHHFETITTTEICSDVRDLTSFYASQRDIQIRIVEKERTSLLGDRILLERMLGNVVRNAIEASKPGQTVTLQIVHLGANWVRFEVRDEGCGVPVEYISRVFERSFTTKTGGSDGRSFGLGLAIARQVAMLHGGQIRLESKPHQTRVCVDLPVRYLTSNLHPELHQPSPA